MHGCCVLCSYCVVVLRSYLHPHEASVLLQLPPHLGSSQPADVEHQVLPLDGLEDVRVVRHVQADLDLQGAPPQRVRRLPTVGARAQAVVHSPSSGCAGTVGRSPQNRPPAPLVCGASAVCPSGPSAGSSPASRSAPRSTRPAPRGGSNGPRTES